MSYTTQPQVLDREAEAIESIRNELREALSGEALLPSDESYSDGRRIWNDAVESRPAIIACCECAEDVEAAVRVARRHGMPLSVRGGGHDWAGRALCDGGLVIDLTRMRSVTIDAENGMATVAGGATIKDVIAAAAEHGFMAVAGNCSAVGMAGLTLGGGYGPLSGKHGLAADNLLSADVVLADGRLVRTNAEQEPELFWALRGGGGNFGVVTSFQIRLHRANNLLAGSILYPLSEAGKVMGRYADFAETMPDELGVSFIMMSGPDGQPVLALMPLWNGEGAQGEQVLHELQTFGKVHAAQMGPMSYAEVIAMGDAFIAGGFHWEVRTRWLPAFTADVAGIVAAAVAQKTSPYSLVAIHHLHGAATRVASEATAFGMRREHYLVEFIACWKPEMGDDASHRQWVRELWQDLAPFALPGGYANLLGPEDHQQAQSAYGGNGARLRALKHRFDPDNVFASAIRLPEQ